MTTNASGGIMSITPDPAMAPQSTTCTSAYTDAVGAASCEAITNYTPLDRQLLANKTYTAVAMACVIKCGANNVCPGTLQCATAIGWCVPPP